MVLLLGRLPGQWWQLLCALGLSAGLAMGAAHLEIERQSYLCVRCALVVCVWHV